MGLACCGPRTALITVPGASTACQLSKIGKFVFQRLDDSNNTFVDGTNDITEQNSWNTLPSLNNDQKIVVTPELESVVIGQPEVLTDSENLDGAPFAVTVGPTPVTAMLRDPSPEQIAALQDIACERGRITVYFIDNNGIFGARAIGVNHAGIIISPKTFQTTDPGKDGELVSRFMAQISFMLPPRWYQTFTSAQPETGFNPLFDIT